ncbi:uncharacterized protein [Glycine max]|uniref:uncharacterized protein isoform X2 n=1 Tax=Glycine max TaxID=3847 RepID=UPI001B356F06|nr:uncharacterized protein LOC113000470 isoform X2 [Glycine max]
MQWHRSYLGQETSVRRVLLFMLYGFAYSGPFGHFLHKLMDKIFKGEKGLDLSRGAFRNNYLVWKSLYAKEMLPFLIATWTMRNMENITTKWTTTGPVGPSESLHASRILFEPTIPFRNKGMFSFCYDNSIISD